MGSGRFIGWVKDFMERNENKINGLSKPNDPILTVRWNKFTSHIKLHIITNINFNNYNYIKKYKNIYQHILHAFFHKNKQHLSNI